MASPNEAIRVLASHLGTRVRLLVCAVGSWCLQFLSYIARQLKLSFANAPSDDGFSYCPYLMSWALQNGHWHEPGDGRAGDWVVLRIDSGWGDYQVEAVEFIKGGYITTIGTQPDADDGGVVTRFERSEELVVGYVRPVYDSRWWPNGPEGQQAAWRRMFASEQIRWMQRRLRSFGYDVPLSGVYDADTRVAVMAFQSDKRLRMTGKLNDETAKALGGNAATQGSGASPQLP